MAAHGAQKCRVGCEIPAANVFVDRFPTRRTDAVFFLSHCHSDHMQRLKSKWAAGRIYCSPITAQILPRFVKGIFEGLIHPLEVNESHVVKTTNGARFKVTLLDANHVPGAVMFLFEGKFGRIFYTGDFRYDEQLVRCFNECPIYQTVIEKPIDILYLDNTYLAHRDDSAALKEPDFPPRAEVVIDIVEFLRSNPKHKVLVGVRKLGKEDMLAQMGKELKELIQVSEQQFDVISIANSADIDTFTKEPGAVCRIRCVRFHEMNKEIAAERANGSEMVVGILPSALPFIVPNFIKNSNTKWFPYSDHCSSKELLLFLRLLNFKKCVPFSKEPTSGERRLLHSFLSPPEDCLTPSVDENDITEVATTISAVTVARPTSLTCTPPPLPPISRKPQQHHRRRSQCRGIVFQSPVLPDLQREDGDSLQSAPVEIVSKLSPEQKRKRNDDMEIEENMENHTNCNSGSNVEQKQKSRVLQKWDLRQLKRVISEFPSLQ